MARHEFQVLAQAREYGGVIFPLCITPKADAKDLKEDASAVVKWAEDNRLEIESLLSRHGAIIFRGFAASVSTPEDFAAFVERGLALPNFPYVGGNAVRTAIVGDRVFTANESPPEKPIPFHHELAQTPRYPRRLLFFCERPPDTGGETPILLSTAVYDELRALHPAFLDKLEACGVRYRRVMTAHDRPHSAIGRGWRATFNADTRASAEATLRARGYEFEWLGPGEDAQLREISPVLDAVKRVPNGRLAFFNQLTAVWGGWRDELNTPQGCIRAGDGSALDEDAMEATARIMANHAVAVPWLRGDMLYLDNLQAQHSRNSFSGKRRVLASLAL